jgi:hypothetical protein
MRFRRQGIALGMLMLLLGLYGCDEQQVDRASDAAKRAWQSVKPDKLLFQGIEIGQSTEDDIRRTAGQPEMVWSSDDGTRHLDYPRGPEGTSTWRVMIDPDGRVRGIEQLLTAQNFANVRIGQTREEIRRLLGKPTKVEVFQLKSEEVWGYRWMENPTERGFFNVHFGPDERVSATSQSDNRSNGG